MIPLPDAPMPHQARPLMVLLALAVAACTPADQTADADPAGESIAGPVGGRAPPFNSDGLATSLVACAIVREGDAVMVSGNPCDLQLLEDIAVHVRRQGAFPSVQLVMERMTRRMVVDVRSGRRHRNWCSI